MNVFEMFRNMLFAAAERLAPHVMRFKPNRIMRPERLARRLARAARRDAVSWPGGCEYPSVYDVFVSERDWDLYYGARRKQSERRLEEHLKRFARTKEGAFGADPRVFIYRSADIAPARARITPSFGVAESAYTEALAGGTFPSGGAAESVAAAVRAQTMSMAKRRPPRPVVTPPTAKALKLRGEFWRG